MSSTDTLNGHYEICPVISTLEQIGSKWRLSVLHVLHIESDAMRFNELKRATDASSQTLSRVLDDLTEQAFVERRVEADGPVAVYYSLTPKGEDFQPVFAEINNWATRWKDSEHLKADR